jgi:heme-degrading monooxygenase HmoA
MRLVILLLGTSLAASELTDQLLREGMAKMVEARDAATGGKFADAHAALAAGSAALDKAVQAEPENYKVRLARAMVYGHLPPMFNKAGLAREDIAFVMAHASFADEPEPVQAEMRSMVARLQPGLKPDRFPKISADQSPIIVAATVTSASFANASATTTMPPSVAHIMDTLKGQRGLLGTRVVASLDRPGQIIILTWWKEKGAVNDWFYGEAHQGLIREVYGKPVTAAKNDTTQVAIELFSTLPGGTRINGGLAPDTEVK